MSNAAILDKLTEAAKELQEATDALVQVQVQLGIARRAEAEALNRCNCAQQDFDAITAEIRKASPISTDWRSKQQVREQSAAYGLPALD